MVLPVTRRGIEVTDRLCWGVLVVAMAIAAGLILYLNRGTTFFTDELTWFQTSATLDSPRDVIAPHNGHLIAVTRLAFKGILETIGAEYLAFRLLHVGAVLLAGALFFALAKRRIGALPALAPTLVVLFLGSAWTHVVVPQGFTIVLSVAAGLAALLALERGDRRGDAAACALVVLSIATYTIGLAFLVGVAISVLLRADRRRRAWIFLVPLALFATWWLWSLSLTTSTEQETRLSNALLIPNYVAESLAAVLAAVSGLGYDFGGQSTTGLDAAWGRVLAVVAVVLIALRVRSGNVTPWLWAYLGILLTYWVLGALAFSELLRPPGEDRYLYLGSVGVLLVAAEAARGIRFSKPGLLALLAACVVALAANFAMLRDGAATFRGHAASAGAQFAMLELARDRVEPDFNPAEAAPEGSPFVFNNLQAGQYLAVADRYGSLGLSPAALARQSEVVRERSDQVQADALEFDLAAARRDPPADTCRMVRSEPSGIELPSGGAILRSRGGAPAELTLGRFADMPTAGVGSLAPDRPARLRIPRDTSPEPWRASAAGAGSVEVCGLR